MSIVTTRREKLVESSKDGNKLVEKSNGKENVGVEEDPSAPPEKKLVKELEEETLYVTPPSYKPAIPFSQRFVNAKVEVQFKKFMEILRKINLDVLFQKH